MCSLVDLMKDGIARQFKDHISPLVDNRVTGKYMMLVEFESGQPKLQPLLEVIDASTIYYPKRESA